MQSDASAYVAGRSIKHDDAPCASAGTVRIKELEDFHDLTSKDTRWSLAGNHPAREASSCGSDAMYRWAIGRIDPPEKTD